MPILPCSSAPDARAPALPESSPGWPPPPVPNCRAGTNPLPENWRPERHAARTIAGSRRLLVMLSFGLRVGSHPDTNRRKRALYRVPGTLQTLNRTKEHFPVANIKSQIKRNLTNKKLDKAVSKGVVHQNQAANRKSGIAKQVAAL